MAQVNLPYPGRDIKLDISGALPTEVISPTPVTCPDDPQALIKKALSRPIGSETLDRLASPRSQVAIIVDDITRETPAHLAIPLILEALHAKGVAPSQICFVLALGTHRPMTPPEIQAKLGPRAAQKYQVVNAPCTNLENMVYMGTSPLGIPFWVHKAVARADLRIGLGMICPHLDAGYGGGAKIILPGASGAETISCFHQRMTKLTENQLGKTDALLRRDLEDTVQSLAPLNFIVNLILDQEGEVHQCVTGDPILAHRQGIKYTNQVYCPLAQSRHPLVLVDAEPHHLDFWQATKGLASGEMLTEDQGSLILLADCAEGMGGHPLLADYIGLGLEPLLTRIEKQLVEDQVAAPEAVFICRLAKRIRLCLVSRGIPSALAQKMNFTWYENPEQAISAESMRFKNPSLGIITHGGNLVPQVNPE